MDTTKLSELIGLSLNAQQQFRSRWEEMNDDESVFLSSDSSKAILKKLEEKLADNYPFFHPRYAGQMLKPPHQIAMAAYMMAMQINPNNHALDGGPATAKLELEVVAKFARMFGYQNFIGHLTSSGTIANLEALWVAKSLHPQMKIAFTYSTHYTHRRMCKVIGAPYVVLDSFDDLEKKIEEHSIGTIVVTLGTTSTGKFEPLHDILPIARAHGVRVHADAAYGGFFTLLARQKKLIVDPQAFLALNDADSIVIDPHKHGLQPYGCGCILFKDPSVGKLYKHDSPYTYFTSADLHLGEISLECSRPGAAAASLWATLEAFPLEADRGLGLILTKTRQAAMKFSQLISTSDYFLEYTPPDLDIVTYFPRTKLFSASEVSQATEKIFIDLMNHPVHPLYLATLNVDSVSIQKKNPKFICDIPTTKILRSVLMKPEHLDFVPTIFAELEEYARTNIK
ncbi:MAG: aminotransferase class I/II-fold pyridoxal phosphate-dependent enzyme [Bacteroidota bacterium]|nr:aminotransferase class I/II-fold pyridoxal phosphate-dependent enzyme [Bacteroidota bacterium]